MPSDFATFKIPTPFASTLRTSRSVTRSVITCLSRSKCERWPAPGSEDTELGVLMELEVGHGETEVHAGVQA
jgi:hypothetical protein